MHKEREHMCIITSKSARIFLHITYSLVAGRLIAIAVYTHHHHLLAIYVQFMLD